MKIAAAHIEKIRLLKLFSVAGRSAIVGRDYDVSLVGHVLDEAVERVHRLRRRTAVNIDDRGVLAVVRQVVGHVDEGGDGPLTILSGVMNKLSFDHVLGAHAAYGRVR